MLSLFLIFVDENREFHMLAHGIFILLKCDFFSCFNLEQTHSAHIRHACERTYNFTLFIETDTASVRESEREERVSVTNFARTFNIIYEDAEKNCVGTACANRMKKNVLIEFTC